MMRNGRAVVHIGTHKTGTTSIQRYLFERRNALRRQGVGVYEGVLQTSHVELLLLSQRAERSNAYKFLHPGIDMAGLRRQTETALRDLFAISGMETYVFSAEGLSYLRHRDELMRLKDLICEFVERIEIIVYLREPRSFLSSYRAQLDRLGIPKTEQKDAFNYVEDDSWLVDYDALVKTYLSVFPCVSVMSYDDEVAKCGNVLPSFANAIGAELTENDVSYWLNKRA